MPKTKRPKPEAKLEAKPEEHSTEKSQYMYRGRNITIEKGRDRTRLFIDDVEVEIEQTEDGVHSHAFMFQVFGTPFELAEELVKQWGNAKPERVTKPHDHPHH